MKLSQWHDGSVKPVHVGVYERDIDDHDLRFSFWNGSTWFLSSSSPDDATIPSILHGKFSAWQTDLQWRDIVKDKKC